MERLTISKLAGRAGINLETVRYYERRRLLPQPPRSGSGYRLYSEDAVRQLRFIKRAQELGFSLKEINELLSLWLKPGASAADVRKRAEAKVAGIEQRIQSLLGIKRALTQVTRSCCGQGPTSECSILEFLDGVGSLNIDGKSPHIESISKRRKHAV